MNDLEHVKVSFTSSFISSQQRRLDEQAKKRFNQRTKKCQVPEAPELYVPAPLESIKRSE